MDFLKWSPPFILKYHTKKDKYIFLLINDWYKRYDKYLKLWITEKNLEYLAKNIYFYYSVARAGGTLEILNANIFKLVVW